MQHKGGWVILCWGSLMSVSFQEKMERNLLIMSSSAFELLGKTEVSATVGRVRNLLIDHLPEWEGIKELWKVQMHRVNIQDYYYYSTLPSTTIRGPEASYSTYKMRCLLCGLQHWHFPGLGIILIGKLSTSGQWAWRMNRNSLCISGQLHLQL